MVSVRASGQVMPSFAAARSQVHAGRQIWRVAATATDSQRIDEGFGSCLSSLEQRLIDTLQLRFIPQDVHKLHYPSELFSSSCDRRMVAPSQDSPPAD